ncbi:MAG: N-acetyltransferase family protein [Beijerinckiaceae bacterium]
MTDFPADFQIRACQSGDIEGVTAIYAHAVRTGTATFEIDPPDAAEMRARWQARTAAGYPWIVAETGATIAGYAYAGPFHARPAYNSTVEDSIYLAPEFHQRGIGAALLRALIDEGERCGFRQMMALIGDSNNAGSIALHRACGFTDAGVWRSVGWKFGRWIDVVVMQRALGPGASAPASTQLHD